MMGSDRSQLLKVIITRTILTILVAYILLNTIKTIQKNYQINYEINQLKQEILSLKNSLRHLENKIVYLESDAYRELEVKRRLGLKRLGEQVILAPQNGRQAGAEIIPPGSELDLDRTVKNITSNEENFFKKATTNAVTWIDWLSGR